MSNMQRPQAQATATGQEKKTAATGDTGQALAKAQSSATGQRRKDDKHVVINLTLGKRFKAAWKHDLPIVARENSRLWFISLLYASDWISA